MALPLHTFDYPKFEFMGFPEPGWKQTDQTPVAWFQENCSQFVFEPDYITEQAVYYREEEVPYKPGLYFLIWWDEIRYVGLSNGIPRRLAQHFERWGFHKYWCFGGVPEMFLEHVEEHYIWTLKPCLNTKRPRCAPEMTDILAEAL